MRALRAVRSVVAGLAVLAVAACGSDTAVGPDGVILSTTPVGNYSLKSVAEKPVPATLFSDTEFTEVIAKGTLALQADGKYLAIITTNETIAGNLSVYVDTSGGTWKQAGTTSAITLTSTDDVSLPPLTCVWSGNTFTLTDADGFKWVFTKP